MSAKKQQSPRWKQKILKYCWIVASVPLFGIAFMLLLAAFSDLPSFEELENPRSVEATLVYSIDGEVLGKYYSQNRVKVAYKDLSPYLSQALIATEDERFRNHSGVDANAILRAVFGAVTFSNKGGGSTITQQLAKMMFHERPGSTWKRVRQKFAEWIISAKLEKRYTKNEIIAMYLNKFDFVNNAVGIHSAAKIYFNTSPDELSVEQAAMLIGMAKNPTIFNPVRNPDTTLHRRMIVLHQMQKNDFITEQVYDSLKQLPLGLDFHPETHNTGLAPYFRDWVKGELSQILKNNKITKDDGSTYSVTRDGLKIYTTINAEMQRYAEKAVEKHLKSLQKELDRDIKNNANHPFGNHVSQNQAQQFIWTEIKKTNPYKTLKEKGTSDAEIYNTLKKQGVLDSIKRELKTLKAGMISIEPQTGFVNVWVGGPDYRQYKYDHAAVSKRQVGSTMKPFAYAIAIRDGVVTPCTSYPNIEYCIDVPKGFTSESWCPQDQFDGISTPIYCALAGSKNNITAKIIKETGGNNASLVKLFKSMDLDNSSIEPVPSLALGVCNMSVLEMTSAQSIFANGGVYIKPTTILRVEDRNGRILYEAKPQIKEVLDAETSYTVLKMLKGAIKGAKRPEDGQIFGTARRLTYNHPYGNISFECAGKTGTTQNNSDGWFMGFVPDLVTGVWVGCDNQNVSFNSTSLGQGANMSAPVWGYFIKDVYRNKRLKLNRGDFIPPCENCSPTIDCDTTQNNSIF